MNQSNNYNYWGTPSKTSQRTITTSSSSSSSSKNKCNKNSCEDPPYPPDIYDVTPYVVDSNGGAPYTTLECALDAAYQDTTGMTPTILLRPGEYRLSKNLKSSKPVNIVGSNFASSQVPTIKGCGQSGGNKAWAYVQFADSKGTYSVNNRRACDRVVDTFTHCKFTENFKVSTLNDEMLFNICDFDYSDGLDRDQVIEILGGSGSMTVSNSTMKFCRSGSSCAKSFVQLAGNASSQPCGNITLFKNNIIQGSVEGVKTFMLFNIVGIQDHQFEEVHVNITKSTPKTYIFGALKKQNNVSLAVHCCSFNGPSANVTVLANLWPPLISAKPMVLHANKLNNLGAMLYGMNDCNGWPDCAPKSQCSSDGDDYNKCGDGSGCKTGKCGSCKQRCCKQPDMSNCQVPNPNTNEHHIMWTHTQIVSSASHVFRIRYVDTDQMRLGLVGTHIFCPKENTDAAIFVDQDPFLDPLNPSFIIHAAFNSFRNLSPIPPIPLLGIPWFISGITNTEVNHNSSTIVNYIGSKPIGPSIGITYHNLPPVF